MQEQMDNNAGDQPDKVLFWGCFVAMVATAFGFILRALLLNEWGAAFNLTNNKPVELPKRHRVPVEV